MEQSKSKSNQEAVAALKSYMSTLFHLPSGHYAKIHGIDDKTVIVFTHEREMLNTKVSISMCHESEDEKSTLFSYPLLKEMNPQDLGTFADYVEDPVNKPYYQAILKADPSSQGITIVRCIEHMKEHGMSPDMESAGESLGVVRILEDAMEAATRDRFNPERFLSNER